MIDNEPTILDGMRRLLEGWSCEVITAADAEEAIKAFKGSKAKPDVMLVDYHLDHSNGIDAVLKLRWRFRSIVPAVLITADRSPEVRDRATARTDRDAQQADQAAGLARTACSDRPQAHFGRRVRATAALACPSAED